MFRSRFVLLFASLYFASAYVATRVTDHTAPTTAGSPAQNRTEENYGNCTDVVSDDGYRYKLPCLAFPAKTKPFRVSLHPAVAGKLSIRKLDEIVTSILEMATVKTADKSSFAASYDRCNNQKSRSTPNPTYEERRAAVSNMATRGFCSTLIRPCDSKCQSYNLCGTEMCGIMHNENISRCTISSDSQVKEIVNLANDMLADPNSVHFNTITNFLGLAPSEKAVVVDIFRIVLDVFESPTLEECVRAPAFQVTEGCFNPVNGTFKTNNDIENGPCGLHKGKEATPAVAKLMWYENLPRVFLYAIGAVFFTAFVASNVLMVAKAGKLKGTRFSHAERRFTRIKMKRKDRLQIVALAVLSLFVGFSMFLHAKSQEDLFWKGGGTYPTFVPWFYTAATVGFYFAFLQLSVTLLPTHFVKKRKQKTQQRSNCMLSIGSIVRREYENLFGIRQGILTIPKLFLFETIEIILQFVSLEKVSPGANLEFITIGSTLLLLNILVSSTLFVFRRSIKNPRIIIVSCDTVFDLLFLCNNLTRGGESIERLELNLWANIGIVSPALIAMKRIRTMYRYSIRKHLSTRELRESSFATRFFSSSKSNSEDTTDEGSKIFRKKLERCAYAIVAPTFLFLYGHFIFRMHSRMNECSSEFTEVLWRNAFPKKMFPNGLYSPFDCGYGHMKKIVARSKQVSYIPSVIGKCVQLEELDLGNNRITNLPLELLSMTKIDAVRLEGNPVSNRLNISNLDFSTTLNSSFPNTFICKFMSEGLTEVLATNCSLSRIGHCIARFEKIERLDFRNNHISRDGISKAILSVDDTLTALKMDHNVASKRLSFQKQNMGDKEVLHLAKFIGEHLPGVQEFDISKNHVTEGETVFNILEVLQQSLEVLNVSSNDLSSLFQNLGFNMDDSLDGKWPKLRVLDVSSNHELPQIKPNVADYFQEYNSTKKLLLNSNNIKLLNWPIREPKQFSFVVLDQANRLEILIYSHSDRKQFDVPLEYFCRFERLQHWEYNMISPNTQRVPECFRNFRTMIIYNSNASFSWPNHLFSVNSSVEVFTVFNSKMLGKRWKEAPLFDARNELKSLHLELLSLTGTLPQNYDTTLTKVEELYLGRNEFVGAIPRWTFENLRLLDLSENNLEGEIPFSLLSSVRLVMVLLKNNVGLNGSLPDLHNGSLTCLDIRGTKLSGVIPQAYVRREGELLLPSTGFNLIPINRGNMTCSNCSYDGVDKDSHTHTCRTMTQQVSTHKRDIAAPRYEKSKSSSNSGYYIWCRGKNQGECRLDGYKTLFHS
jgi:Leucine-rich repeat (LRR) protein